MAMILQDDLSSSVFCAKWKDGLDIQISVIRWISSPAKWKDGLDIQQYSFRFLNDNFFINNQKNVR
jgi:hypothetical protein